MNSEYIIGGKGQSAIMGASWGAHARGGGFPSTPETLAAAAPDAEETETTASVKAATESGKIYSASARNRGPEAMPNSDMRFEDFIDIVNPLQHIPLVNMVYRAMTGDKISGVAQIAGSALYGGPLGIVSGVANAIIQEETGKDVGDTVIAMLNGGGDENADEAAPDKAAPTMLAQNAPSTDAPSDEEADTLLLAQKMPAENPAQGAIAAQSQLAQASTSGKPATKQPFGGIYDTHMAEAAKAGAPNLASAGPVASSPDRLRANTKEAIQNDDTQMALAAAGAAPLNPAIGSTHKFYSLENAVRRGDGAAPRMPMGDSPDVRLKPLSRMAVGRKPVTAKTAESVEDSAAPKLPSSVPLVSKEQAGAILGLNQTPHPPVVQGSLSPASPILSNGRNPLPQKLIEDMMLQGIQKYEEGQRKGTLGHSASIDIEG
jgi:hypothetical protein